MKQSPINSYHKYQLTHPYEGHTIYKTKTLEEAAHKCYKEWKVSNYSEKNFTLTDLDTNTEYKYAITQKISQEGGQGNTGQEKLIKGFIDIEKGLIGDKERLSLLEKKVDGLFTINLNLGRKIEKMSIELGKINGNYNYSATYKTTTKKKDNSCDELEWCNLF